MRKRPDECRNGHPFTPENIILKSDGRRRCRTCRVAYMEAWRAANPEKLEVYRTSEDRRQYYREYNRTRRREIREARAAEIARYEEGRGA